MERGIMSERELRNAELSRNIAREGAVLLKNNGVLPLKSRKIALFGTGGRFTITKGTGSGDVHTRYTVSIEQGLEALGVQLTTKNWLDDLERKRDAAYSRWHTATGKATVKLKMQPAFEYVALHRFIPPEGGDIGRTDTDTAVYVLARQAGENADRRYVKGDMLLTDTEFGHLNRLTELYRNTVLVLNMGSPMDLSFLDQLPGIGAVVYAVQGGMESGAALAELLTGRANFSGKLTDTIAKSYADIPFGKDYSYLNSDLEEEYYREGIYVGYRYFDSFGITPRYPFGFGLSYTSFKITTLYVTAENTTVAASVSIANTGAVPGREVVQLYVSCPDGKLVKEYQVLAAFRKTDVIEPGRAQDLTVSFDMASLASYDEESASWVLEPGEYTLRIGSSSRDTRAEATVVLDRGTVTERCKNICPLTGSRDFEEITPPKCEKGAETRRIVRLSAESFATIKHDYGRKQPQTDEKLKAILKKLSADDRISLCVGDMFRHVRTTPGAGGQTTARLYKKYGVANINFADGPAGLRLYGEVATLLHIPVPVKLSEDWELGLPRPLVFMMKAIAKLARKRELQAVTGWPVATMQAQTWDPDLIRQSGEAIGHEMLEYGITTWLAPGMNIHRNPLCGRNFEYYSEDPLLSGQIASALTEGVQSVDGGIGVTVKHFCCNNQEDGRMRVSSNVHERALREIYLRGFRITVTEALPQCLMTSYNRLNGVYTANRADLNTDVLRREWGFEGLVMSDWSSTAPGQADPAGCVPAGNDLIMPGGKRDRRLMREAYDRGELRPEDLNRSAYNVLKVMACSPEQAMLRGENRKEN